MLKYLWKNKVALFLFLLALWLVPTTIGLPEQSQTESIVTAIGIDKNEDEYEVSLQYIVPSTSGGVEELKITTQKGKTVGEAIEFIKLEHGKLSGFAHCRFLAFNDNACKTSLTENLDYLLRRKTNTNNIVLINTPESAKDLLSISTNLDSDLYSFLNNAGSSNELRDFHDLKTIGDYYESYFSPVVCMTINSIDVKEKLSNSSSSQKSSKNGSDESSGSNSENSNNGESKKEFENKGKQIILKNDKKLVSLTEEQSDNLVWFNKKVKRDHFVINNYSEDDISNIKILFNVHNKIYTTKAMFEDKVPHLKVNLKLYVRTGEIFSDNLKQQDYQVFQKRYSNKLVNAMQQEVISKMKEAETHFKENNYDVVNCYDTFYKFKNKQLKEYLKNNSKEEFIKNVVFDYNVEIIQGV